MKSGDKILVNVPKIVKTGLLGSEIEYTPMLVTIEYVFESEGDIIYFKTIEHGKHISFDKSQIL